MPAAAKSTRTKTSAATEALATPRNGHQRDVVNRLRRIEGQVRALVDMVESGRPCEDVAQQMSAARKAMDKAFYRMMACSVLEAMDSGNPAAEIERATAILEKYA